MLFSSYFRLTLALLPAITAYTLDPNLPDGVYAVQPAHSAKFTRHDGEIHGGPVRIGNVGPQSVPRLYATGLNGTSNATLDHGTEKRGVPLPISDSHCSTWNRLNEEDYSYALAGLKARCDTEEIPAYKYSMVPLRFLGLLLPFAKLLQLKRFFSY